uniref:Uncharacterized protein n=1 Tax=Anguilla anguilla TaxID=7936 RepID=A0A0E9SSK0_ANGAN
MLILFFFIQTIVVFHYFIIIPLIFQFSFSQIKMPN